METLRPLKSPKSNRASESFRARIGWQFVTPLLILVFLPASTGVVFIGFLEFLSQIPNLGLKGWSVELLVAAFYLVTFLTYFFIVSMFDVVAELSKAANHAMQRTLSIVVVGFSDLLFPGSTIFSSIVYGSLVVVQLVSGYSLTIYVAELQAVEHVVAAISGHALIGRDFVLHTFIAGLALMYVLLLLSIPLLAIVLPSWRNMVIRPRLLPVDESTLAHTLGYSYAVKVAHISDLHVREKDGKFEDPNAAILLAADAHGAAIIALTGDLTDDGSESAWSKFLNLPLVSDGDSRVVMVPGNHDLNTLDLGFWQSCFTLDSLKRTQAHKRAYLFLQAANQVMGHRSWVVCPFTGAVRCLSAVFSHAEPVLQSWDRNEKITGGYLPEELLHKVFPMVVETKEAEGGRPVLCVVWNTVKANRWALLNAIGELGSEQVKRAEVLLAGKDFSDSPLLHLMHHQIAVPRQRPITRRKDSDPLGRFHTIGMGLQTAEHFLGLV